MEMGIRFKFIFSKDGFITWVYVNDVHIFNGFAQNLIFLSHQKLECV
jgi:hypothetical protein